MFYGEEMMMAARFYTHGYDIYTPDRSIIAHDYDKVWGRGGHTNRGALSHSDQAFA